MLLLYIIIGILLFSGLVITLICTDKMVSQNWFIYTLFCLICSIFWLLFLGISIGIIICYWFYNVFMISRI